MSEVSTVRDLRRGQIVAAARRLVADRGLEGLTIAALEERLSFTRGVITYHFAGKQEIVEAVLASAIEEIDAATSQEVRAGTTPHQRIRAVIASKVDGFLEHVEAGRILLNFWGRIGADPRVRDLNARLYRRYRAEAVAFIAEGARRGAFRQVSPEALAAVLVGMVIGIATQAYFDPDSFDPGAATDEAAHLIVRRLTGRGPRSG